jgi:large subunit ribosomal protein L19
MNQIIQDIESPYIKTDLPELNVGDTVKVFVKIIEGGKERTQGYEGVIIKRRGSGVGKTITVRRVFQGIGIERVFPLNSPRIEKIKVQRRGHVRRAKLYYLRERTGKATRIKEKVGNRRENEAPGKGAQAAEKQEENS